METQHTEPVTDFLDLMSKIKYFTKLKPDAGKDNSFTAALKVSVSGYNELNSMVSDLLKTSITVLKNDASGSSASLSGINVLVLLEIALQLLPDDEIELLDELHTLYLKLYEL